jgi:hypothetical protein
MIIVRRPQFHAFPHSASLRAEIQSKIAVTPSVDQIWQTAVNTSLSYL